MLPHLLTNFEIQRYYQDEPKFNGVYSCEHVPKEIRCSFVIKICKQTYSEYKHIIQFCMDIFALELLTTCSQGRL